MAYWRITKNNIVSEMSVTNEYRSLKKEYQKDTKKSTICHKVFRTRFDIYLYIYPDTYLGIRVNIHTIKFEDLTEVLIGLL